MPYVNAGKVLILVLVEDGLGAVTCWIIVQLSPVLILVLVEDGLGDWEAIFDQLHKEMS